MNTYKKNKLTLLKVLRRRLIIAIERIRGVDFSSVIQPNQLGFDDKIVIRGSPSGNSYLHELLKDIGISKNDSILDIGCSKGSAIKCMYSFPFNKIDGIEISHILSSIAIKNFKKLGLDRTTIFNLDAVNFTNYGDYNYFYLYNPFPDSIMKLVIPALVNQIGNQKAVIIYNNPVCHERIVEYGFKKIKEYPDEWGNGIYIYANNPNCSN